MMDVKQSRGKVAAVVQVRMGSSRLPGKVMRPVDGVPLLGHLLARLQEAQSLDEIVVATSINSENDVIDAYCQSRGVRCFRGAEDDVLGRIVEALTWVEADTGVEIFGDCPLIDPALVDEVVGYYIEHQDAFDFVGNDLKTTYPPGMEVEVFRVESLIEAHRACHDAAVREHGTLFLRQHPERFRLKNLEAPAHLHRPLLELEVDTEEDFQVITQVLQHFRSNQYRFSLEEVIRFMDGHQALAQLNQDVPRRWKEFRES